MFGFQEAVLQPRGPSVMTDSTSMMHGGFSVGNSMGNGVPTFRAPSWVSPAVVDMNPEK